MKFARHIGRRRGVVDENRALAHGGKGTILGNGYGTKVVIIADAGKDDVLALCRFGGRAGRVSAMLGNPGLGLGIGAIVDRDLVATLVAKMARHRIAHDAKAQKCNFHDNMTFMGDGEVGLQGVSVALAQHIVTRQCGIAICHWLLTRLIAISHCRQCRRLLSERR